MRYIKPYKLREVIFKSINTSIEMYRESKRSYFLFEHYPLATDSEINDFIDSSPFFDYDLKNYLINSVYYEKPTLISNDWYWEFCEKVYLWSEGPEWLFYDIRYICDPSLNIESNIKSEKDVLYLMETLDKIKFRNFNTDTY